MKVLITGGAGFVGSFTAAHFVEQGHDVVIFDVARSRNDVLQALGDRVTMLEGDIRDAEAVSKAVREHGREGIIHAAAVIGQQRAANDPRWILDINVGGTTNVLEALRAVSAEAPEVRMVCVATASLYGMRPDLESIGEDVRPDPFGMYDTTKLMAETLAISYHKVYGLDIVSVRPGYVYGPNTWSEGYYLDQVLAGEAIERESGADLPMDVTYVKDLALGIYLALTVRPVQSRIFNITSGALRASG